MGEFQAMLPVAGSWGSASIADTQSRVVFHTRNAKAAGLSGPILRAQSYGAGHALQLGPDEWLLLDCHVKAQARNRVSMSATGKSA
jgi:sarcosine oxidase gamma subunit